MNFCKVCSEMPSTLTPCFDTNRANFLSCLAGQAAWVQCKVLVPLAGLTSTRVGDPHTGHRSGMQNGPTACFTLMTFGMILLALITSSYVPFPPIPRRSHSLMLQSEARFTVVPSSSTGRNTATGEMVDAAQLHSTWSSSVLALSSAHLKA